LLFEYNVQHLCHESRCQIDTTAFKRQERELTSIGVDAIVHANDTRFVLNLHALHNAALVRKALPELTKTKHIFADRASLHLEAAVAVRAVNQPKRAAQKVAQAERRAAKKAGEAGDASEAGAAATTEGQNPLV
jgi:hypothetical protein